MSVNVYVPGRSSADGYDEATRAYVADAGHLYVAKETSGGTDIVAIYAPGSWRATEVKNGDARA